MCCSMHINLTIITCYTLLVQQATVLASPVLSVDPINATATTNEVVCRPVGKDQRPLSWNDCRVAIDGLLNRYHDGVYTFTHDSTKQWMKGYTLCPFSNHHGDCGIIIDIFPSRGSERDVRMNWLLAGTSNLVDGCLLDEHTSGGYQFYGNSGEPVTVIVEHVNKGDEGASMDAGNVPNAFALRTNESKNTRPKAGGKAVKLW